MQFAKSTTAASFLALLIQYPIAFAYIGIPFFLAGAPFSDFAEFLLVYALLITVVALPVILFVGLPAFLWFRKRYTPSPGNMAALGAAIAAILTMITIGAFFPSSGYSSGEGYYGTYRDMIVDGVPTIWGWISYAEDVFVFAIHGALGAVFFLLGWRLFADEEPESGE